MLEAEEVAVVHVEMFGGVDVVKVKGEGEIKVVGEDLGSHKQDTLVMLVTAVEVKVALGVATGPWAKL